MANGNRKTPAAPRKGVGRPARPAARKALVASDEPARREHLLDAAAVLFAQQGVAATTAAQIAGRVHMTAAMVNYYFKGREALLEAFVVERMLPFAHEVWDPVEGAVLREPARMVLELTQRVMEAAGRRPWLPPLWVREIASDGGQLRQHFARHLPHERMEAFAAAIAQGQKRGRLNRDLEARFVFISILGLTLLPLAASGMWKLSWKHPQPAQEALARHVHALLGAALRADVPAP